jgi:DNA-directed RNA polymerase subunit RPC12/RpoP
MREKPSEHKKKVANDIELLLSRDLIMRCPKCGGEVGLWSEDEETTCTFCNHRIFERETTEH